MMKTAQRLAARRAIAKAARHDNATAGFATIARHQPIGISAAHNLVLAEQAFKDLAAGSADHELFGVLAMAINCSLVRAETIDPLLEQTMQRAVVAMVDALGIFERHGRCGFTGPGLDAVRQALDAYDAIARASNPVQMQAALTEVMRRYRKQQIPAVPPTEELMP